MNMTPETAMIRAHLDATEPLVKTALARLKDTDGGAYAAALKCIQSGATIRVTTALSVAGLCEVGVALVDVHGTVAPIAEVAFTGKGKP